MADGLSKIGRGGAGNFWSKKDLNDAAKAGSEDVEAQKEAADRLTRTITAQQVAPEFSRSGRGGAGNISSTAEIDVSTTRSAGKGLVPISDAPEKKAAPARGYGGRGGAGNWRSEGVLEEEKRVVEEEELKRREVEERAKREVEGGLAKPESAYTGVEK